MRIKGNNNKKYQSRNTINTLPNKFITTKEKKGNIFSSSDENIKKEYKRNSNKYPTSINPNNYKLHKLNGFKEDEGSFTYNSNPIEKNNNKTQELNSSSIAYKPKIYNKLVDNTRISPMKITESKNITHTRKTLKIENPEEMSLDYFKSKKLTSKNGNNNKVYKKNLNAKTRPKLYVNQNNYIKGSFKKYNMVKSKTNTNSNSHSINTSHHYTNSNTMKNFFISNPISKTIIDPVDINFNTHNGSETHKINPKINNHPKNIFSMKFMKRPAVYHPNERVKNKIRLINNNEAIKIFNISFNDDVINNEEEEEIIKQKQKDQEKRKKEAKNDNNNILIKNYSINQRKFKGNFRNLNATEVLKCNTLNSVDSKESNLNLSEDIEFEFDEIEKKKDEIPKEIFLNFEKKNKILIKKRPVNTESSSFINYENELIILQKNKNNIISEIKISDFKNLEDINKKLIENNFCVNNIPIIFFSNDENKKLVNKIKKLNQENNSLKYCLMNSKFNVENLKLEKQVSFEINDEDDGEE